MMPMMWLANSFLVRQPGGYGEMALYAAANNFRILGLFLPNVINNVGLSVLNNEKAKGDMTHYNRVFRSNVLYIFFVSLGSVLVIGIFGRLLLQLFGKEFGAGHVLLWLLLVASIFESVTIALYQYVQSQAQIWLSFFSITVPRDTFLVVAAYYLVQSYGGAGLAVAYMGSTGLGLILIFSLVVMLYRKERKVLGFFAVR
jgi:O-antigen/teichoic acid export membrane protein